MAQANMNRYSGQAWALQSGTNANAPHPQGPVEEAEHAQVAERAKLLVSANDPSLVRGLDALLFDIKRIDDRLGKLNNVYVRLQEYNRFLTTNFNPLVTEHNKLIKQVEALEKRVAKLEKPTP